MTRRDFLAATGALGLGSILGPSLLSGAEAPRPAMPRRLFGKTGVSVPILGLGCMFDIIDNQVILRQTFDHGVTYWDTAAAYEKGGSERGISMFLDKNPSARKELFLVTKGQYHNFPHTLDESLARLKTDYVDLFLLHNVKSIEEVDRPDVRAFAEKAKKDGKIRFFGFSTHTNMAQCLAGAAKLGWIDGILVAYSFRIMHEPDLRAALDACEKAGIGLTAMKTQGQRQGADTPEQAAFLAPLIAGGLTPGQAKLKVVLENPQIANTCVQMPNLKLCRENMAAALDPKALSTADRLALARYAAATDNSHCAGCARLCEPALAGSVPVREVMRHLMYERHYGGAVDARALFSELPAEVRERLARVDYAPAERACPHGLAIGSLMREAASRLA